MRKTQGMRTEDAIAYYGTGYAVARALGLAPPSVYRWKTYVPALRQLQLEALTGGKLRADPALKPETAETLE